MGKDSLDVHIQKVRRAAAAFREAQIYITFAELDLGPALSGESTSVSALAEYLALDAGALRRFIDAAAAFGLVNVDVNGHVELTSLGRALFSPDSEQSLRHAFTLEGAFYERWGRLPEAIRLGGRPPENREQEDDPEWVRTFTLALYENARDAARAIAQVVDSLLPPARGDVKCRILDLGGGHGGYSLAIARTRPDVEATVFDLPPVIAVTSEVIEHSGLSDRVSPVAGDFHLDPLGGEYDLILLFGVLHGETPENAVRLLQAVRGALSEDGFLLIRSRGRSSADPEPGEREIFDLHMLLSTEGGTVRRPAATTDLVERNGFRLAQELDVPSPGSGSLLVFGKSS